MAALAALLIVAAIVALIFGGLQKFKAGRLAAAPFVKTNDVATKGNSVAGQKGAVSVEGNVGCPQPLVSPVTGTPCLYYKVKVVGSWKEGDSTKSKDYYTDEQAVGFNLDDGSGPVPIDARKGGDLDLDKKYDETKKEGFFADIKNAVGMKEPIVFGNFAFQNPPMSVADKFNCTEYVLPVHPRLYVLGKHDSGVITSPSWTSLIISKKSRDQLMGSTAKAAKFSLIGGGAGMALGVILALVAHFTAPKKAVAATVDQAPVAAAVAAAPAAGEPDEINGTCAKTVACCKVLAGKHSSAAACDNFLKAQEETCQSALLSYKKAVRSSKGKKAAALCD
jgi:E3 Ubiquitin ligase